MKNLFLFLVTMFAICVILPTTASAQNNKNFNKPRGYMGLVELSTGASVNGWSGMPVSATMVNGYRFMPQLAVGIGTGVQFITMGTGVQTAERNAIIPLFLHLRSDFLDNWISPYVAFNTGYNFALSDYHYSGFMFEPTLGVGFNAGRKSRVTVGVFCAVDNVLSRVYYDEFSTSYRNSNCVMGLKAGMSF